MKKYWIAELVFIPALIIYLVFIAALIICLAGGKVFGQDKPQAAPTATPTPAPKLEDSKEKPIIVTKTQVLTSENLLLKLQNAQLAAAAAVPPDLKKAIEDAEKALTEFYAKEIGIPRDQLSGYDITPGVGGDLILRKKAAAPAPEKK